MIRVEARAAVSGFSRPVGGTHPRRERATSGRARNALDGACAVSDSDQARGIKRGLRRRVDARRARAFRCRHAARPCGGRTSGQDRQCRAAGTAEWGHGGGGVTGPGDPGPRDRAGGCVVRCLGRPCARGHRAAFPRASRGWRVHGVRHNDDERGRAPCARQPERRASRARLPGHDEDQRDQQARRARGARGANRPKQAWGARRFHRPARRRLRPPGVCAVSSSRPRAART